ncbi:hypothetical protein B7C42_01671 [Nocardia cerradoensis]|uniref:Uncharacterized protein n=1 Tax=Nocardia cerradoensis TaxID=85688 RepID=A0A231HD23_9NOCA|nr:hypothetical protein [Nocardia cerradoensis]OXR46696.1 hypothetical protein B7C42_01671 [Nocardia cerradoensis]
MSAGTSSSLRTAIQCIRPDLTANFVVDIQQMTDLLIRLGYEPGPVITINPYLHGPLTTVMTAIAEHGPDAVIVPDFEHIDGLDRLIRERAQLIVADSGRVSERIPSKVAAA